MLYRIGWLLLALPLLLTFGAMDSIGPGWYVVGYFLFGLAVWIWMGLKDERG